MNDLYYILPGKKFIEFIDKNMRKSIPYEYIKDNGILVNVTLNGLDYLTKLGELLWKS